MKKRSAILAVALALGFAVGPAGVSEAAIPPAKEIAICQTCSAASSVLRTASRSRRASGIWR